MLPFSDEELFSVVEESLEKVKPMLKNDGGDVTLIAIKNGIVFLQLQGACVGCASSGATLKFGIEKQLRMDIHPEIAVINVPFGMEDKLEELI